MPDAAPLRIGLDGREILDAPTGVGRYLFELLDRWTRRADRERRCFLLYLPQARLGTDSRQLRTLTDTPGVEIRPVGGLGGTVWEQTRLPSVANRDRLDVFFAPAYSGPLSVAPPLVLVIHDVSYMAHPEWFSWQAGVRRRTLTRWSARKAAHVLTVSEFSAREIQRHLDLPSSRLEVIRHGPPPVDRFGPTPVPSVEREPLVLFAGSIFNRRHVPDLVRAFAPVARRHPGSRLVIAGENRSYPPEDPLAVAASLAIGERVVMPAYLTDEALGDLYRRASAFAFLSVYEGFGLTPLEALSLGVPVVVYDTPVAREIYDEAAIFVAPGDLDGVSDALERLLSDPAARQAALAAAPRLLARYSWDRAADATLAAIERAAAQGERS